MNILDRFCGASKLGQPTASWLPQWTVSGSQGWHYAPSQQSPRVGTPRKVAMSWNVLDQEIESCCIPKSFGMATVQPLFWTVFVWTIGACHPAKVTGSLSRTTASMASAACHDMSWQIAADASNPATHHSTICQVLVMAVSILSDSHGLSDLNDSPHSNWTM